MISHLAYVSCDRCGEAAQPASGPYAAEARGIAHREGFVRRSVPGSGRKEDICPRCRGLVGRACRVCGRSGGELTESGCPTHGPDTIVELSATKPT